MTMRKPGLVFILCVGMLQLVPYTNGEVTPPWITLLGCFDAETGSQIIPLSSNSPTNCFKECKTFSYVGMQVNNCICSKQFQSMIDVKNAQLRSDAKCRMGDNTSMTLYAKVSSLPNTINQDTDYGHVYVNISSSSSYEFHASKESPEKHAFICYEFFSRQCRYRTSHIDHMNSTLAWKQCNLVSYFDFDSCQNKENGVFWIGMYRDSLDFSSTSSTLLTKTSPLTSSSMPTTTSELTTDPPATTSLKVETKAHTTLPFASTTSSEVDSVRPTSSPLPTEKSVSQGNPDSTWKIIATAFIAISVTLLISIIAGLVAFLRKKKENQISHTDQESIIKQPRASTHSDHRGDNAPRDGDTEHLETDKRSQNSLPLRIEMYPEKEGHHVFEEQAKHITPIQVGQSDQTLQNLEIPTKGRRHRRSHHPQDKHVTDLPDRDEDHIPDIRKRTKRHRKSHHREQTDANNMSNTAMEEGKERHKKRRKRRKSHLHSETDVTNVSDTALEHSLLDNLEDDNSKRKESRKSKKRKQKHANTVEESDGINVS